MSSNSLPRLRFSASVMQVSELLAIYRYIHANSEVSAKDNILRAALAMLVSAIDTSVHEIVINSILKKIDNHKLPFDISRQTISMQSMAPFDSAPSIELIEADLRQKFAKETFQTSRQLEAIFSNIGINKIWSRLSVRIGDNAENIKLRLDLMVKRRNQIVHEADLDSLHCPQLISIDTLDELHDFTKLLVYSIFDEVEGLCSQNTTYIK